MSSNRKKIVVPRHLSPASKLFFKKVCGDYLLETHHLKLLALACQAWDQGEAARKIIKEKGLTFTDKFGQPKPRPEVKVENDCRICFARLLRELQLDISEVDTGLPRSTAAPDRIKLRGSDNAESNTKKINTA